MKVDSDLISLVNALTTTKLDKGSCIRRVFKVYTAQLNVRFQYMAQNQYIFINQINLRFEHLTMCQSICRSG